MKAHIAILGFFLAACGGTTAVTAPCPIQTVDADPPSLDAGTVDAAPLDATYAADAACAVDAIVDASVDASPVCHSGAPVGSCTDDQATDCAVFYDDAATHQAQCNGRWDPTARCFDRADRTTGGCDFCSVTRWAFILGGPGADASGAEVAVRQNCLDLGGQPL